MLGSRRLVAALFAAVATVGGCATPFAGATSGLVELDQPKSSGAKDGKSKATQAVVAKAGDSTAATALVAANPAVGSAGAGLGEGVPAPLGSSFPPIGSTQNRGGDGRDLAALIAEMQSLGTLGPAEQQALLDDLKQSDPALWPQLIRQFRTAMAYRKTRDQGSGVGDQLAGSLANRTSGIEGQRKEAATAADVESDAGANTTDAPSLVAPSKSSLSKPAKVVAVAAESQPAEPPLRPALKRGEHKAVDQMASGKPTDGGSGRPIAKAAAESPVQSDDWQLQLTKATLAMEGESAGSSSTAAEVARQVQLRLLYLTAGRRDDALRPIPGLSAAQQEFWTKELYGLVTYLDSEKVADPERRATEAALHLREAAARIGELASPVVRNLAFCKEVTSFGVYKKFPKYEFKAGDEALLYCEIENLKAESTDRGYHTSVKSSYQILDSRGERVADQEFPASEDFCASQRRDFFIPYFIWIPKRINEGTYTLQLTVEDTQTKKVGQSSIQFSVR